ncbi:Manganese/iron superoxide dismutase [Boletus coccyginus]|nr:Manganese/iron superoxide dismutase [Boletus coccyginus]
MNTAGLRLASSSALTASKRLCPAPWAPRRHVHTRKALPYKIENGLGNFMSPKTLQMVAVEYQQGLLDRLNEECRDVEDKRKSVAQLVLDTARSQDRAILFKHASHALNNSFFLNCLRPPSEDTGETRIDASYFGTAIQKQFGGFDSLRSLFSAAVNGMAGSGYVWFVTDAKRNLAFVPTFASGTLLIRSGAGTVEPITEPVLGERVPSTQPPQSPANSTRVPFSEAGTSSPFSGTSHVPPQLDSSSPARTFHTCVLSREDYKTRARSLYDPTATSLFPHGPQDSRDLTTLGEYIYPLFCISVHEHCWLLDHGIWGKEKYLKEFWTVVDWNQVVKRFETFATTAI